MSKQGDIETCDTRYFISSLRLGVKRFAAAVRGHWGIENRLHWVRDVTFDEDRSQVRKGHGPQVLAAIRNFIIGLLRRMIAHPRTSIASAMRHFAASPAQALGVFTA